MSKSRGNVITPDEMVEMYGVDALRVYELFMGPFDQNISWSTEGISGSRRWLVRVWNMLLGRVELGSEPMAVAGAEAELSRWINRVIKRAGEDIDAMKFNTMVAYFMEFTNWLYKVYTPELAATETWKRSLASSAISSRACAIRPLTSSSLAKSGPPPRRNQASTFSCSSSESCSRGALSIQSARSFAARQQDTEWSYTRSLSQSTAGLRASHGESAERLTTTVNHYLIKPFDKRWASAEEILAGMLWTASAPRKAALEARKNPRTAPPVSMFDKAANVDELNVIHAAQRMAAHGAQTRLLIVLADGMTRGSVRNLANAVSAVERGGATVLGIGIGDDTVAAAYPRHQVVHHPGELARAMVEGTKDLLRRSLHSLKAPAA